MKILSYTLSCVVGSLPFTYFGLPFHLFVIVLPMRVYCKKNLLIKKMCMLRNQLSCS
jgi:hypothetical protein